MPRELAAGLYSTAFFEDPYPTFKALRESAPVWWSAQHRAFVVSTYAECVEILYDDERFADTAADGSAVGAADASLHGRFRASVRHALGPLILTDLESTIQDTMDELIAPVLASREMDFMRSVGDPLPTHTLAHILGVPPDDQAQFTEWAHAYTAALGEADLEVDARYKRAATALLAYFTCKLAMSGTSANLVSHLASSAQRPNQILALCDQLMVAARDLTTALLGNTVHALLAHPSQLALLQDSPALVDGAIEESLRWDTPVLGQARVCRVDTRVGTHDLARGTRLLVMFGAANHDPRVFQQPECFDITRPNAARHLAFGRGLHSCLGGPTARLQARVTVCTLLERCANLRLAEQTPRRRAPGRMLNLRAFRSLPICWD
jgi:cytochrome P450